MQQQTNAAAQHIELTPRRITKVARRVIGGITLYPDQFAKINARAESTGLSRSAIIRQLIDQHL